MHATANGCQWMVSTAQPCAHQQGQACTWSLARKHVPRLCRAPPPGPTTPSVPLPPGVAPNALTRPPWTELPCTARGIQRRPCQLLAGAGAAPPCPCASAHVPHRTPRGMNPYAPPLFAASYRRAVRPPCHGMIPSDGVAANERPPPAPHIAAPRVQPRARHPARRRRRPPPGPCPSHGHQGQQ